MVNELSGLCGAVTTQNGSLSQTDGGEAWPLAETVGRFGEDGLVILEALSSGVSDLPGIVHNSLGKEIVGSGGR